MEILDFTKLWRIQIFEATILNYWHKLKIYHRASTQRTWQEDEERKIIEESLD
ncbi:MAG: hypothetical protein CH6_0463 [Candidatus Kapaibacterium sp.]|nr:MAG: hypothetical protein CH6_0463 [Candidatus Kapabacteria bacterium]